MDIKEAAYQMISGYKVRRASWENKPYFIYLGENKEGHPAILNNYEASANELDADDLLANDWEIYQ